MMDLDYFKRFNEAYGPATGDRMLVAIADELRNGTNRQDLIFRLELEEFVVILERDSKKAILDVAGNLRRAVGMATCLHDGQPVRVTASAGLAFIRETGFRYAALQQAETAMYLAKITGRDTLVLHDDVRQLAADHGATLELADLSELADAAKERFTSMADRYNKRLLESAERDANVDGLTQLHNRRYFDKRIAREIELARRNRGPLSLALFDIDDFGNLNKMHGHPTGDAVLRQFGQIAKRNIRTDDWFARYGGEEFCLVTPLGRDDAHHVAERIRVAVANEPIRTLDGGEIAITVSVGLVQFDSLLDQTSEFLVQRASRANREAKDRGKNVIVLR
jgi:diguanylate cyclase (GGDEF)-like protein